MLKKGGEEIQNLVTPVIKKVWEKTMPEMWKEALLQPLLKRRDNTKCDNYRGIALLDVMYKIFTILIKERQEEAMEKTGRFRKGRSIIDQIHIRRRIQGMSKEHRLTVYTTVFIDFKKAYDNIRRAGILRATE
ncbi:hypothetical protein ILUMI_19350 [Ignelater luminosus]|uniref:Reverse transcriptase domain-containing protein n=1 Tax=Ignelater luminosus TaxID=2038154 RepID=A0A8K0CGD0_IGNLU|nr:hypothetical protein ILUMI_19350 [Ignelater luminosus]